MNQPPPSLVGTLVFLRCPAISDGFSLPALSTGTTPKLADPNTK